MFSKFIAAGLLAAVSTGAFAQEGSTLQKNVNREKIKIELEANCHAQVAADRQTVQRELDATKGTQSPDRDALLITAKRLNNTKKSCREIAIAADLLAEQLGENAIPGGFFLTMGADVSSPVSIPLWKIGISPGVQFLVGTGALFPVDKNLNPDVEGASISMKGWHVNGHNRLKPASALEGNVVAVIPVGFSGKFKSVENMSGSYLGINVDVPFSNSAIKNTSVVIRVFVPVSLDESRLDELTWDNAKSVAGFKDLKEKFSSIISDQRPYLIMFGAGAGGKDPAFQIGLEKMYVHASK